MMREYSSQPITSVNDRINSTQTAPLSNEELIKKFKYKAVRRQRAPLTVNGFEGYVKVAENGQIKIKPSHAAGPIIRSTQDVHTSFLGHEQQYDPEIINNWYPHMSLSVFDEVTEKPLTAAEIASKQSDQRWMPHYFNNPMQELDYIVLEALGRFTFGGPLIDGFTKYLVGTGFKPELELINPSKDEDKNEKEISEGGEVIDTLSQIDKQIDESAEDHIDISFQDKTTALIGGANMFNRAALMFGYDTPVELNGKKYPQIPSSLKYAHPRDLGIIDADPRTWRLRAVQWRNAYNMIQAKDMIYLWNPVISAKTRNSWLYGDSMMMPMIDALRVVRKNIGVNFNAMAEATWAGIPIIFVKPQGETPEAKMTEYGFIANNLTRGGPNIMMENPLDTRVDNIDFNPKVAEFVGMTEFLLKYCVADTGMPHSMFWDEDTSNRATMIGKIELATATVINPIRNVYGRQIANQWYQRWFRLIYKDSKPDLFKKYRIKLAFSNLNIAQFEDKIEAVNAIDSRKQLTDEAYGDMASIPNYASKVVKDAPTKPGGNGTNSMSVGEGEGFKIQKAQKPMKPQLP